MQAITKISPQNLLEWGDMEDWESGASAAPTEHVLTGTGATIAREATIVKQGTYSASVTRVGNDATLYHDHQDYEDYQGRRVTLGCWVYATVASRARIGLSDGVGSAQSSYHTGTAGWEFLTVSLNVAAAATRLRVEHQVNTGNTTAYFDGGILCEGDDTLTDLSDGSQFYVSKAPSSLDIRLTEYDPARRDGIVLGKPRYDKRSLKFTGQVLGSTAQAARDNFDTLKIALLTLNGHRVDGGLLDFYLYDDRLLRGRVKNWDENPMAARRIFDFDFDFVVPSPFAQALNRTRHKETISSSPDSFDVTVGGTIFTKPTLRFIADQGGNITSCTLQNLTTGESVSYVGTVTSGDTLVIDCDAETVVNDVTDDLASHTGDFIQLLPGVNKLRFSGSLCTIKIDWLARYV